MKTYVDSEGAIVRAYQPEGCAIINSPFGEVAVTGGDWVIEFIDSRKPVAMTNEAFLASFTELDAGHSENSL